MFERETELIISGAAQRTIGTSPSVAIKEILAADIPSPIKTFFRADVELLLAEDIGASRRDSKFNFRHPDVEHLQQQMNTILVLEYRFERVAFLERLSDSVHLLINYLIRPQWTLTSVVFEKEPTMPTPALLRMMRYFAPYDYLREIVSRYAHDKQITTFTRPEFSSILWKIDGEYMRRKSGDEAARILYPLYEFFDFPVHTGNLAMPMRALIKFFEDKGITSALLRLEGEHAQGMTDLTLPQLGEILEDVRRMSGAFEAEHLEPRVELDVMAPGLGQQSGPEPEAALPAEAAPQPLAPSTQPRSRNFLAEIAEHDKRRFLKKLFRQEEAAFEMTLQELGAITSWKDASRYIDEMFIKRDIDPYSSEAERFIEIVYHQFHQKK